MVGVELGEIEDRQRRGDLDQLLVGELLLDPIKQLIGDLNRRPHHRDGIVERQLLTFLIRSSTACAFLTAHWNLPLTLSSLGWWAQTSISLAGSGRARHQAVLGAGRGEAAGSSAPGAFEEPEAPADLPNVTCQQSRARHITLCPADGHNVTPEGVV